jgi:hypothetical protein
MAEWLEDHMVAIGPLNPTWLFGKLWLNWRPGSALRRKVETVDWEGRGVVCGKPTPPRL